MSTTQLIGVFVVAGAGLLMGGGIWPMKLMRKYQFEHWWFIGMLLGLIVLPWTITLLFCHDPFEAYSQVKPMVLVRSNLFALGWGIANVLCGLCFIRIGVALTGAILTGVGVSLGVTLPMVFKGSGIFSDAKDITSPAGITVLIGVAIMVVGVCIVSLAGFGRDRALKKQEEKHGSFLGGLIMTVIAGLLSCGMMLAFVYSQGPIIDAMKANGAGDIPANFSVWAVGLMGGALVNIIFPIYLMTKNKSWGVLLESRGELLLSLIIGAEFCASVALAGKGALLLGTLGASVGFGIQQAMQMLGGQGVGFISGEWRGVTGKPRYQMYSAIAILIIAAIVMAYGNNLAQG